MMTPAEHPHHQRRKSPHPRNHLSDRHRRWLYLLGVLLFASGAGWLLSHYGLRDEALVSVGAPHPSELWWLRLHGAALLGFLVAFGALLPLHIRLGWRQRLNRTSGLTVILIVAALTVTGYGLYYAVGDGFREWISLTHWTLGLISMGAVILHVAGRRYRPGAPHRQRPPGGRTRHGTGRVDRRFTG
jgi:cation transport ATPase